MSLTIQPRFRTGMGFAGWWQINLQLQRMVAIIPRVIVLGALLVGCLCAAAEAGTNKLEVVDGIVMPKRPVVDAIRDAMQFLKKADGGYKPGKMDGPLAGYFTSAFVNPDGSRSERALSFPGRQHAYFIFTFLRYYAYSGEQEWLQRARDLAEWNLANSTPAGAVYSNVPYSTFSNGKPGGSKDVDSIEPDKSAFLGTGYLAVYEATGDPRYLEAAIRVARTLTSHQRKDGSWPFRVVPETGIVRQEFGGAPVFFVEFFEKLRRHRDEPSWRQVQGKALEVLLERHIEMNQWGTYHEDIVLKPEAYLSAEPMSFTADYLFRHARTHPEYIGMGRKVLKTMEDRLVHTEGHAAAPAPTVSEQAGFDHIMPGHTARYCLALADLYAATGDEQVRRMAMSGINAVTYMQSEPGLFRTFFHSVNAKARGKNRPDWYSQHLYTVCHVLEAMRSLPEIVPDGQTRILGSTGFVRDVQYKANRVFFETGGPSLTVIKLDTAPESVQTGARKLSSSEKLKEGEEGWAFDAKQKVLRIKHKGEQVEVVKSR